MWIVITRPFIDRQAEKPEDAEVPAGKKMNVTAERGAQLVRLGLAEASETDEQEPALSKPARARAPAKPKVKPAPPAVASDPAAVPAAPAVAAELFPIALDKSEPVGGLSAAETTTTTND